MRWKLSVLNCRLSWGMRNRHRTGNLARITCSTNSSRNNPKNQFHESISETGRRETSGRVCYESVEGPEIQLIRRPTTEGISDKRSSDVSAMSVYHTVILKRTFSCQNIRKHTPNKTILKKRVIINLALCYKTSVPRAFSLFKAHWWPHHPHGHQSTPHSLRTCSKKQPLGKYLLYY